MSRIFKIVTLAAFVAGCGADGMPTRPEAKEEVKDVPASAEAQLPE